MERLADTAILYSILEFRDGAAAGFLDAARLADTL
jgi:hypothetical protein